MSQRRPDYDALRALERMREIERINHEPKRNCPTRIMDGRNELRCWFLEGHEGDCK